MRPTFSLIRHVLGVFLISVCVTRAEPISYYWTTLGGHGGFGDRSFANNPITVAIYADTDDVQVNGSGVRFVSGPAVVMVGGMGYSVYVGARTNFCGDAAIDLQSIFTIMTSFYSTYDLKTNSPPQSFLGSNVNSWGTAVPAEVGNVVLWHDSALRFEAQLGVHSAPTITNEIPSMSVVEGASPKFTASLQGTGPFWIQWRKNGVPMPGRNFASLTLTNVTVADADDYDVVVTNIFGMAQSQKATLSVNPSAPVITLDPVSQDAVAGTTVNFDVSAIGTPPISWKWYFKNEVIPGQTGSRLTITNIDDSKLGTYYAEASNSLGTVPTGSATLGRSFIVAWGLSPGLIPPHSEEIISMTGGDRHYVALRANGNVDAWGGDSRNQGVVPQGLSNVVSIGAGSAHSIAVNHDGEVTMWGQFFSLISTVAPETKFDAAMIAMGVGAQHGVVLKRDGTLVDWGTLGTNHTPLIPPANATNIVSVAAGANHTLALRADGRVMAWGRPAYPQSTNIPAFVTNVVAIAAGWFQNVALRADGRVAIWGSSGAQTLSGSNCVDIAAGSAHTLVLRSTGQITSTGSTDYGLTIVPAAATNAAAVAAGNYTAFALMGKGAPVFNTIAMDRNVEPGQNAYFRMWAVGAQPIKYQWNVDGTAIQDATNSWLVVSNVQAGASASYTVTASNESGEATSKAMGLNLPLIQIMDFKTNGGALDIHATGVVGETYRIEFKTDLSATGWTFFQDIEATAQIINFAPPLASESDSVRFYRIRRL